MAQLKELLIEELQDLLHAETQLTGTLPKMAEAAHNPKLKEAFEKHLVQTENHVARLQQAFSIMGEKAQPILDSWKAWLSQNNAVVTSVLFLIFAVVLIGKGIAGI